MQVSVIFEVKQLFAELKTNLANLNSASGQASLWFLLAECNESTDAANTAVGLPWNELCGITTDGAIAMTCTWNGMIVEASVYFPSMMYFGLCLNRFKKFKSLAISSQNIYIRNAEKIKLHRQSR